jgi:hypothetical protein
MKEDNKIIKIVYTFFLGILIAIFIGVGVNTFYPSPEAPKFPSELNIYGKEPTKEQEAMQKAYDKKMENFNENEMQPYNRNVSIITLSAAVILLAVSLFLEKKNIKIIADGVMLGGLFTLIYSLGRSIASQDSKYSFLAVTIGLAIVIYLGYHRFVQPHDLQTKKVKAE